MKKVGKISSHGGARKGAGRKPGATKRKISVSVDETVLDQALRKWEGKASQLFEKLLKDYVRERSLK